MQQVWHVVMTISVFVMLTHTDTVLAQGERGQQKDRRNESVRTAQLSTSENSSGQVDFNIPPQPLGSAVTAFADQANYQLLVTSDMTEGVTTNGVTGRHTPEEAIGLLLAGTGLTYRLTEANTITLEPATISPLSPSFQKRQPAGSSAEEITAWAQDAKNPVKVPEVVVKEVRDQGYTAEDASSATRLEAPIRDLPVSVGIIKREVLEDQKGIRIQDVIRNVPGTSVPHGAGGRAEQFNIRGFTTDVNVFKNGFRDDGTFSSRTQREVSNLERIEVLKGPGSWLYGRTDPGGIINLITKRPLSQPYYSTDIIIGSYNLYRPTVDISGPLNEAKSVRYRFNGVYEHAESFRDFVQTERIFVAPTFDWKLGARTSLVFEAEYLRDIRPIDRGLVAIGRGVADIPVSRFLGDPIRRNGFNVGKATLILRHDFSAAWGWRTGFRSAVANENYNSIEGGALETDNRTLTMSHFQIPQLVQSHYLQNEVIGRFHTGPISHRFLAGVELGREVQNTTVRFADAGTLDIFNPVYAFTVGQSFTTFDGTIRNNVLGAYVSDLVTLHEQLKFTFGGRFDVFDQQFEDRLNNTTTKQTNNFFNPLVGLVYQPIQPVSVYASYSQSARQLDNFTTFNITTASGGLPKPEKATQYEAGVKTDWLENRLSTRVALFRIEKENVQRLFFNPARLSFFDVIQTGEERSQGVEFETIGRILPGWDVIATYAYIDAEVNRGDAVVTKGNTLPNAALHSGSLWTTYMFQDGFLKNFGVGGGMFASGKRLGDIDNTFEIPGFVRLDAALYYRKTEVFRRTNLLAQINFRNLLDQRYFEGTQESRSSIIPGAPLTVIGSLKLEFF